VEWPSALGPSVVRPQVKPESKQAYKHTGGEQLQVHVGGSQGGRLIALGLSLVRSLVHLQPPPTSVLTLTHSSRRQESKREWACEVELAFRKPKMPLETHLFSIQQTQLHDGRIPSVLRSRVHISIVLPIQETMNPRLDCKPPGTNYGTG